MFFCLIGCVTAQLTIRRWHDRQVERLTQSAIGHQPSAVG
jgi:uncharacterized membrane protein YhaH (DUF805 family)